MIGAATAPRAPRPTAPAGPRAALAPRAVAALLAAWCVYTVALGSLYVRLPPSPDSAVFDYIGWRLTRGARLYVDVAEQNFPGQMWLQAVSTALFGQHLWSYRLFDVLVTIASGTVLLALLRRGGAAIAGFVALPLYQAMIATAGLWVAGQRDVVGAEFLAAAGLAHVARRTGRGWVALVAFSLLCVAAMLVRPTYALFPPLLLGTELILTSRGGGPVGRVARDALAAGAIGLAMLGAIAAVFWRTGALAAWYELAVLFNVDAYAAGAPGAWALTRSLAAMGAFWHWYLAFAIAGAWAWRRDRKDARVLAVFGAVAATAVISAFVQRKGFGYHLGGLLVALAPLSAYFISRTIERARASPSAATVALAIVVCGIATVGTGKKVASQLRPQLDSYLHRTGEAALLSRYEASPAGFTLADAVEAASYVTRTTSASASVLTWSRAIEVNFLSARRSPTRFATVGVLALAREPFSRARAWADEFATALAETPPEIVLAPAPGAGVAHEELWLAPDPSPSVVALRQALSTRYRLERRFGTMDLYRLRHDRP